MQVTSTIHIVFEPRLVAVTFVVHIYFVLLLVLYQQTTNCRQVTNFIKINDASPTEIVQGV